VPGIEPEYGMPSLEEVAPALVVSSLTSWQEVGDWWWALVEEALHVPDPKVEEKAKALVAGLEGKEEKAARIYDWVVKNIKYVALEFGIGG
ncbi:MAG: transglutaminase, partial [Candidatus Bipolaricaulota bacterium]|nr:transglutaminase [Candidatus Bipolaricaulota bacterium]MDW8127227.1 transglutaminase [Candidatus Bipolaricaulota bacterium]